MNYTVVITKPAEEMLGELRRFGKPGLMQIRAAIEALAVDPVRKTQPLQNELRGLRSLHVGRFRIIVEIVDRCVTVYVVAVGWHESGHREDVYRHVLRLIRSGRIRRMQ